MTDTSGMGATPPEDPRPCRTCRSAICSCDDTSETTGAGGGSISAAREKEHQVVPTLKIKDKLTRRRFRTLTSGPLNEGKEF